MGVLPERILLATDGSEDATRATEAAWDLASRGGAELHVIHVWHDVRGFAHDFVKGELKRQGQEVLDGQVEKLRSAGGEVAKAHLRGGRTSNEVLALGGELGAGLLVVGSRGLGTVQRILMG
ncbi:MAG TPA: universal stress protein, partial [Rubrobacter sp.]